MKNTEFLDRLTFEALSIENWNKFESLFGTNGACGNCWCMYYRLTNKIWTEGKHSDSNKNAMKSLVENKMPTGLLAILDGQAIAWAAFAPRKEFAKLGRSRIHKPIDNKEVWSVPCLFVDKKYRRSRVSEALLKGLVEYASGQGIKIVEAYPIVTTKSLPDAFVWTGTLSAYQRAGFEMVDETSPNHPTVRCYVSNSI